MITDKFNFMDTLEIQNALKNIIGNNAFNNDMQVEQDVSKLAKTVSYLTTQYLMIAPDIDKDSQEYIQTVLNNALEILKR